MSDPISKPRLVRAAPALGISERLSALIRKVEVGITVGTAVLPVTFAHRLFAAIGAKLIVPVEVIVPPVKPVPVATALTAPPPPVVSCTHATPFQYSYCPNVVLNPSNPV